MPDFATIIGYLSGVYLIDPELEAGALAPTLIVIHVLDAILCSIVARHSGRKPGAWALAGLALGVWGVLPLLLLPAKAKRDHRTTREGPRDHRTTGPPDQRTTSRER